VAPSLSSLSSPQSHSSGRYKSRQSSQDRNFHGAVINLLAPRVTESKHRHTTRAAGGSLAIYSGQTQGHIACTRLSYVITHCYPEDRVVDVDNGSELDHDDLRAAPISGSQLQVRHHRHIRYSAATHLLSGVLPQLNQQ
jgi:hypothetical protein